MSTLRAPWGHRLAGLWGRGLATSWKWLRSVTGDDAYERYLAHLHEHHPGRSVMGRREFYLDEQRRRWGGGVNRCC